jgi:hypothetical protein
MRSDKDRADQAHCVRFKHIGGHARAIAYVVAYIISNNGRIAWIVFLKTALNLAHKIGAYVAMVWLVGIAINLLTTGMFFDLAVRDVEIAIGAYALARLTELREEAAVPGAVRRAPGNGLLQNASR